MMRNKVILFLLIGITGIYSYPWPVRNFSEAHSINATMGDYRMGTENNPRFPRFHNGVDIQADSGTAVFSIESDTCIHQGRGINAGVRVGNYAYIHLIEASRYPNNMPVVGITDTCTTDSDTTNDHPTRIGKTNTLNHVHFIDGPAGGPYLNPLRGDGLDDYSDGNPAIVSTVEFFRNRVKVNNVWRDIELTTVRDELKDSLYGKVEIRAKMRDNANMNVSTGIYKCSYIIRNPKITPYILDSVIVFRQVTPPNDGSPVVFVYDTTVSRHANSSTFRYWVTNHIVNNQVENRYWNTKLRFGQAWDGLDARINAEARFPDGKCRVWVLAYDIDGNGGDTLTRHGAEDEDVILDNFVPYLDSVVVIAQRDEGEVVVYRGWWDNSLNFHSQSEGPAYRDDELTFSLFFSEEMEPDSIDVKLRRGGSEWDIVPIGWSKTRYINDTWKGSFHVPDEEEAIGVDTLVVKGRDVVENKLDSIPSSIAYRDTLGEWQAYEGGKDINHSFEISPYPIVLSTVPRDSAKRVFVNTKITFIFSNPMDTVSVRENLSISPSFTAGAYYEWSENSETLRIIPADTMTDLLYSTDYTVILSGNAKDKWGYTLDGNENGEMEGSPVDDYTITFKTNKPELFIITEPLEGVKVYVGKGPGSVRKRHKIYIINLNGRKKTVTLDVTQKKPPPDSIYPYIDWEQPTKYVFELGPFREDTAQLWVESRWAGMDTVPDNISALVLRLFARSEIPGDTFAWAAVTYPVFPPRVAWIYPPDSARNVSLDDTIIKIKFTKSMNWGKDNVHDIYVDVSPPLRGEDKIVKSGSYIIIKGDTLKKCTDYDVTVYDMLTDVKGHRLDGDKDGLEDPDFNSVFFTEDNSVKVWAEPLVGRLKKGEDTTHTVHIQNQISEDVDGHIEISGGGPGWITIPSLPIIDDFTIPPEKEKKYSYTVINNDAVEPLDVIYKVSTCRNLYGEGYYWNAEEHIYDHPDESYEVSDEKFPTPWYIDTKSDIGVLLSGWGDGLGHILGKYGVKTAPVKPNLKIVNEPYRDIKEIKVLLIGSAGLMGMNSPAFREGLKDFVNNGGTIICFTQQHGYEWDALPVPEGETLAGYGWSEDQSCHNQSVYLDEWHSVLSGQHRLTPDMNVDGWFKKWPKDAKLLFKRTVSGMPGILMYPFGKGWVVVTSLYSDWSYGHWWRTDEEIAFVRDLVTWAVDTKDSIPEYYKGDTIGLRLKVKSLRSNEKEAKEVVVKVYSPDRESLSTFNFQLSTPLLPGDSTFIDLNYTAPYYLGIYPVNYVLLDSTGDTVQTERMII